MQLKEWSTVVSGVSPGGYLTPFWRPKLAVATCRLEGLSIALFLCIGEIQLKTKSSPIAGILSTKIVEKENTCITE